MKGNYSHIYFIGIGGIGMSALARYFLQLGCSVAGYDRVASSLTKELEQEGAKIHYEDWGSRVQNILQEGTDTLVVYTPAIPKNHKEFLFLKEKGYALLKRSEVLEFISKDYKTLAVAGTHGKTTTTTMLAHVLHNSPLGCNAFLGGISANFNSNFVYHPDSDWLVVEADEFDRSFLHLHPYSSIVTSVEADHLDIYNDAASLEQAFGEFIALNDTRGSLILNQKVKITTSQKSSSYGLEDQSLDFCGMNLRIENHRFVMDVITPQGKSLAVELGLPGIHNAENAMAVIALCSTIGLGVEDIRSSLKSFKGVKRRFEKLYEDKEVTYIDDYAHHPTEITRLLESVRLIYKDKPISIFFQPHLYSRTRDFMEEFAAALSLADKIYLLPIYPAREQPIEGISSAVLAKQITQKNEVLLPQEVVRKIKQIEGGVILTVGAGDISLLRMPIQEYLNEKNN